MRRYIIKFRDGSKKVRTNKESYDKYEIYGEFLRMINTWSINSKEIKIVCL